jgi:protein TonB
MENPYPVHLYINPSKHKNMGTLDTTKTETMRDIVFENRNKAYGAYVIRGEYDRSLIQSFAIAMLAILTFVGLFHFMPVTLAEVLKPQTVDSLISIPYDKPFIDINKPKPPLSSGSKPPVNTNTVPRVTEDSLITKKDSSHIQNPDPGPITASIGHADSTGKGKLEPYVDPGVETTAINIADTMPEFPGGEAKLVQYLSEHIKYPREAFNMEVSGTVYLKFVVAADGSIRDVTFLKKIGHGCEDEARRVVEHMPRWKPGRFRNRAVPVYFYLPVTYRLQ